MNQQSSITKKLAVMAIALTVTFGGIGVVSATASAICDMYGVGCYSDWVGTGGFAGF